MEVSSQRIAKTLEANSILSRQNQIVNAIAAITAIATKQQDRQPSFEGNTSEKIELEKFLKATLTELESWSGIDSSYWCRWFKGAAATEVNLKKASRRLGLSPGELLDYVIARRKIARKVLEAGRRYTSTEGLRHWQKLNQKAV